MGTRRRKNKLKKQITSISYAAQIDAINSDNKVIAKKDKDVVGDRKKVTLKKIGERRGDQMNDQFKPKSIPVKKKKRVYNSSDKKQYAQK